MKPVSSMGICKHFLDQHEFKHITNSIPLLLNYFERGCQLIDINREFFGEELITPEFLLWAISGSGIQSTRRSYEVLESYGDTVLKLAATLLAFYLHPDSWAMDGDIDRTKVAFITNFHLFRVGYFNLKTHRHMRMMKDPEPHQWSLPFQKPCPRDGRCSGKTIADSVESLTGAHFLAHDSLVKTLRWISKIKLVPLPQEIT